MLLSTRCKLTYFKFSHKIEYSVYVCVHESESESERVTLWARQRKGGREKVDFKMHLSHACVSNSRAPLTHARVSKFLFCHGSFTVFPRDIRDPRLKHPCLKFTTRSDTFFCL